MERQLGAPGDFAWAYVIAHEVGHHIQQQLGTSSEVDQIRRSDPDKANDASVRLELQADCYAGVWARGVFDQLEPGDLDEALTASEAVGDDRLQQQAGQRVNPDSFTHGSSEQRRRWFERGRAQGRAGRLRHVLGRGLVAGVTNVVRRCRTCGWSRVGSGVGGRGGRTSSRPQTNGTVGSVGGRDDDAHPVSVADARQRRRRRSFAAECAVDDGFRPQVRTRSGAAAECAVPDALSAALPSRC